jgi:ribonuclease Z
MLDVCLLGTGGMMPLPNRWLTALYTRYNGSNLLIDCGEGTQIAMREAGLSPRHIDVICFTHYHGDHVAGLPGLLLGMGNADRTEPLTLIGPKGLTRVVNALRVIAPELPFEIQFKEISGPEESFKLPGDKDFTIHAYRVNHNVTCYCYAMTLDRTGKFDVARAMALDIPKPFWNRLQKGETIETEKGVLTPDMVLGAPRKGLKVGYCTDSRPCEGAVKAAQGADLFICEGMWGQADKKDSMNQKRHMLMQDACALAVRANAKRLWLTHYSPAEKSPEDYADILREIYPEVVISKDGEHIALK